MEKREIKGMGKQMKFQTNCYERETQEKKYTILNQNAEQDINYSVNQKKSRSSWARRVVFNTPRSR
jgi:hypothetical protein